jgi:hypothetical protein
MPMLDEEEFAAVNELYKQAFSATKEFRRKWGIPLETALIEERFRPVRDLYSLLTGMEDCHENAIMHHRFANFGPPCARCGKPLRTPKAKICGSCMAPRQ